MEEKETRELVAGIFDGSASFLSGFSKAHPAFAVGSALASSVAALVRNLGVVGASETIAELVARKEEGKISTGDIAEDDAAITDAVSDLFNEEEGHNSDR